MCNPDEDEDEATRDQETRPHGRLSRALTRQQVISTRLWGPRMATPSPLTDWLKLRVICMRSAIGVRIGSRGGHTMSPPPARIKAAIKEIRKDTI